MGTPWHQLHGVNVGALVCSCGRPCGNTPSLVRVSVLTDCPLTSTISFLLLDTDGGRKVKFLLRSQTNQGKDERSLLDFLPSPTPISPNHKAVSKPCLSYPLIIFTSIFAAFSRSLFLARQEIYFGPNNTSLNLMSKILVKLKENKIFGLLIN